MFLAKDVAHWLEYKGGVSLLMKSIDEDEKGLYNVNTLGGSQKNWFLTEDGIYEVLMLSRKPIAKQWKKEVKKILKNIRLNGGHVQIDREEDEKLGEDCSCLVARLFTSGQNGNDR